MMEVIPFDEKYLENFEYDGIEKNLIDDDYTVKELVIMYAKIGEAYLALDNGKVIGVGGIYPLFFNRAKAWALLNQEFNKHLKTGLKAMKAIIDKCSYKEILFDCISNSPEANKLAEYLGFKLKGVFNTYSKELR